MKRGSVHEKPIGGAFNDQGVAGGPSDKGGFDEGGGGTASLDGDGDKEPWDVVVVAHVPSQEMFPSTLACCQLHICHPLHCLISW